MPPSHPLGRALFLALLALSAVFAALALLFLAAPARGAAVFGLAAEGGNATLFVRAIGLRDLALAGYLFALTLRRERAPLFVVLATTTLIPAGDLALLVAAGAGGAINHLLHLASLLCFAGLAWWVRRGG